MGWKIYFWLLLLLLLTSYAMIFIISPSIWDFIDLAISSVALLGLFSYAYKKVYLVCNFWRVWLVVILSWDIIYNLLISQYLGLGQDIGARTTESSLTTTLFGLAIITPEYIAIYLLGYKSNDLWKNS